ncbi:hypothetical protein [Legionella sp.]|uniref:hypothetical protein n=1 Tax=Legionella sp. TaxID=459 RepID=UPI0039E512F7
MKPYSQIVEDTGIPQSTLERYIKELNDSGFIERRQALYSRTNETGAFEIKKGTYIYITEQLLGLLKPSENTPKNDSLSQNKDIHNEEDTSPKGNCSEKNNKNPTCSNLEKNEGNDPVKMRGIYIRDLYYSFNNNIKLKQLVKSVDKTTLDRLINQYATIQMFVNTEIKEEISEEIKKLLLGTFFNLTFEHKKQFSSPGQVAAEYLFSLINTEFCLPSMQDFKHRNNSLSKIMRSNNWRTPKGFYNHFYLGQNFKDKQDIREKQWQETKERELNQSNEFLKDDRLTHIEELMFKKSTLIEELTKSIHEQTTRENIAFIREQIQKAQEELECLWHQQSVIEQELEQQDNAQKIKRCA